MVNRRPGIQPLEKWIDSFQFVGKRTMAPEEKQFLASHLVEVAKPSKLVLVGIFAFLLSIVLAASGLGYISDIFFGPFLALEIIVAVIIPMMWREQLTQYKEDLADLTLGEVELYQSGDGTKTLHRMVYLPRSNRVLSQQGQFLDQRRYLRVNLIAPRFAHDDRCFPKQFSFERGHLHLVRPLTKFERNELGALLPHSLRWKWVLPAILWVWTFIGLAYLEMVGLNWISLVRVGLVGVSAVALSAYYLYRTHRYELVVNDLRRGTVVCENFGCLEFEHLENSDLIWTVDSLPAPWRKRSSISTFCPSI